MTDIFSFHQIESGRFHGRFVIDDLILVSIFFDIIHRY